MIDEANFEVTRSDDNLVGFIAFNRPKRGNAVVRPMPPPPRPAGPDLPPFPLPPISNR